jgi:hypothetical protein
MLTDQDKRLLDRLDPVDVIEHYGVAQLLSFVDPLHAISIWGWLNTFNALEKYEAHKPE